MVDVNFRRSKCADNVDQGNRERENIVYNAVASRIVSMRQGPSKDTRTLSVECPKVKSSSMASLC